MNKTQFIMGDIKRIQQYQNVIKKAVGVQKMPMVKTNPLVGRRIPTVKTNPPSMPKVMPKPAIRKPLGFFHNSIGSKKM